MKERSGMHRTLVGAMGLLGGRRVSVRTRLATPFVVLAGVGTLSWNAAATTELPLRYSGRQLAMGGTGVAYVDDASSAAVNPAGMDNIEHFSATVTATPFVLRTTAPFSPVSSHTSDGIVPLFFVGAGFRPHERLTFGAAFYAASGVGATYDAVPELGGMDVRVEIAVLEGALPVAFRITDEFSVGAALRVAHVMVMNDVPVVLGPPGTPPQGFEQDLSGTGFPGVLAGMQYQPTRALSLGATYRSKMTIEVEGEGTAGGLPPVDISSEWSTPHSFGAGVAWSVIPDRLLIALDLTYTLFDDAVDALRLELAQPPGTAIEIPFNWENSLAAHVGGEYLLTEKFAGRLGYSIASSATPEDHASATVPPPGLIQTLHAGGGLRVDPVRVDIGAGYGFGGADVSQTVNGPPGRYESDYWLFGGSVTYQM